MSTVEQKVHATGHYSQLLAFWVILGFFIYIGVQNELHPAMVCDQPVARSK